jgi:hypothetical protein
MADAMIRPANRADLPRLTEIYNYYVINTAITFDLEPFTVEARVPWFEEHSERGRHRLMVAVEDGIVLGYASTGQWRVKGAYMWRCSKRSRARTSIASSRWNLGASARSLARRKYLPYSVSYRLES